MKKKCSTAYCRNKTISKHCSTCRSRVCRANDPVRSAFNNLKNNAKKRDILFTITIIQFREWCCKVTYIGFAGRNAESFTIDRKHNDCGYHIDNIKVMTKSANVKKYFSYDYRTKQVMYETAQSITIDGDEPF